MRRSIVTILGSMLALSAVVNTHAQDKSNPRNDLKDSVRDTEKRDLSQLISYMLKNSEDGRIGENLAPVIGLSGPMPMKAEKVREKRDAKGRDALTCAVVYETSDPAATEPKKPTCIFLLQANETSEKLNLQYFRVSLDGQLEKVVTQTIKKDADGKIIPGSGVAVDDDKDSSPIRKAYASHMHEVKSWLKKQEKLAKAGTSKSKDPAKAADAAAPLKAQ